MLSHYFQRVCLLLSVVFASGCVSLANSPQQLVNATSTSYQAASYALPADYELPPYIRIVSLPLVSVSTPISANTLELGDYWLFSNDGYVVQLVELPSIDAIGGYLAHQNISVSDIHPIQVNGALIKVLYGQFKTRHAAKKALASLNEPGGKVRSIRALKAERCHQPARDALKTLCSGTPVKTLTIAEVRS